MIRRPEWRSGTNTKQDLIVPDLLWKSFPAFQSIGIHHAGLRPRLMPAATGTCIAAAAARARATSSAIQDVSDVAVTSRLFWETLRSYSRASSSNVACSEPADTDPTTRPQATTIPWSLLLVFGLQDKARQLSPVHPMSSVGHPNDVYEILAKNTVQCIRS